MNKAILLALISTCLSATVLAQFPCCFDPDNTLLPFKAYSGNTLTNADCRSYCKEANYYFSGTQNGNECWCGNDLCFDGDSATTSCSTPCAGNSNEQCGGFKVNSVSPTNARYVGCYVDAEKPRDFWTSKGKVSHPSWCMYTCRSLYDYYAIQNGDECYCSDSFGRYGPAPESDCLPCPNNNLEKCGGPWRNSVYKSR